MLFALATACHGTAMAGATGTGMFATFVIANADDDNRQRQTCNDGCNDYSWKEMFHISSLS